MERGPTSGSSDTTGEGGGGSATFCAPITHIGMPLATPTPPI
jgi:hypothetical protein